MAKNQHFDAARYIFHEVDVVQKDKKAKMRYGSYIMYMILQRTGLPESAFDTIVKTSRTQLRPQTDDHPDELPLPALFGEPSDTVVPAAGDTAAATSAQAPPSPVHHHQANGVTGDDTI